MHELRPVMFTVPGEPVGKGRPRIGRVGAHARMFTPAKTVAYEGLVAMAAQQAMAGRPLITRPCLIEIWMYHQVPASWSKRKRAQALAGEIAAMRKPDADNCLKAICDACNGVVWRDDVQATRGIFQKLWSETPGVHVKIVPLLEGEQ
ncbi:RusA family crossover junction endodeoxyribonuclease [Pseudomonas aeruginosa]|uniref:RusA family crossover junction endodeoxyribonuclease n=1 Tax=Pseudomonas aeruginosa TaxID=287 RepID=UPI003984B764